MKRLFAVVLVLLLALVPASLCFAEADASSDKGPDEGYKITESGIDIALVENGSTGYLWDYELDDESILSLTGDEFSQPDGSMPGAAGMHIWHFNAVADGEALLSFYYERPWETDYDDSADEESFDDAAEDDVWLEGDDEYDGDDYDDAPARAIDFIVSVVDGKVVDCEQQDYSDDDNQGDGDESIVPFAGEAGGVPLEVPFGMTESQTEEGTLLTAQDGTTILINYEPNDDAEALFEQLKDDQSAAKIYDDETTGTKVVSCTVDRDAEVPSVTMVYYIKDGIAEYTGYQAPAGGVLHVHTTYLLGEDTEDYEEDNTPPEDSADGTVG